MSKMIEHFFKPICGDGSNTSGGRPGSPEGSGEGMEKIAKAGQKQGAYTTISVELKTKVAKYAAENGVSVLLRHFKSLKELGLKGKYRPWLGHCIPEEIRVSWQGRQGSCRVRAIRETKRQTLAAWR